jgi:hypothetical protein
MKRDFTRTVGIDTAHTCHKAYGAVAVHTRLESNLKSRKQRVRLVIVMATRGDVPVIKVTVLQQEAHVLA